MEVDGCDVARRLTNEEGDCEDGFKVQLHNLIATESLDFESWTSIISETETDYPDNIENISLIYDTFLSKFPLCHVYWKRYADHNTRLCGVEKAVEIFERAVKSAPHSVSLWLEYCSFSIDAFEDPFDIRWLFKRGISYVGKDYLCHTLWDKFIEFECSQEQWSSIAHLFIQTLRFPCRKLHVYYKNFKKFTTLMEIEMEMEMKMKMDCENNCIINKEAALIDDTVKTTEKEIYHVIKDLEDSSDSFAKSDALKKYIFIGEQFYKNACLLDEKIHCYEDYIKRSFFHVKPLDDNQLANWHQYLDFMEEQDDFDWSVKVYERCLIVCANYPEYWMRYVDFTESNGGRELAKSAVERASQVILRDILVIHQFSARFKEKIGDLSGARAEYHRFDSESNSYVENIIKEANMEQRLGNLESASSVYQKALKVVAENHKLHNGPLLYVQFSRLRYMITGSSDAAIDVIVDGIQHLPSSRLLLEELINFTMIHEGSRHLKKVDSIVANVISSNELGIKDREDLSCLYLEFVDIWGTYNDTRKAWNRHIRLFPNLIRTTSYNNASLSDEATIKGESKRGPFFIPNLPSPQNHTMTPDRISTPTHNPVAKTQKCPTNSTQDAVSESQEDSPMDSTHNSIHESQVDSSKQPAIVAIVAEASQIEPENLPSDSTQVDKESEIGPTEVDDEDDAPPPGFSHPQAQPTSQIPVKSNQDYNQQMMQSYYQQQMMQQQLLQLQPYLQQQQQQQHEQMMVQQQQYQIQGGSDPVQVQQYLLYMQQQQQQYIQQYQQQQYQQQLYNMQYAQMLQQQQQQQQIPLIYHQQPPASVSVQKLPVSPPVTATTAASKSRTTRSQTSGHKSQKDR